MTGRMASASQAELVDRSVDRRLIVFGSVPPDGRDLDLLVPDAGVQQLAATLSAAGFRSRQETWARFAGCGVEVIDVVAASSWRLPAGGTGAPVRRRRPARRLAAPGATRAGARAADLGTEAGRQSRADRAPPPGPDSGCTRGSARRMGAGWRAGPRVARPRRPASSLRDRHARARRDAPEARRQELRGAGTLLPKRRRGTIVAISGLDGSGKTTQAEALTATLRDLDHDAGVQWSRITYDQSLQVIARPVKLALGRLPGRRGRAPEPLPDDPTPEPPRGPEDAAARALRARHPVLNQAWAGIVAAVHVWGLRRSLVRHLRGGRVVVRDRYVLDSAVELRHLYGGRDAVGFATGLVQRIFPPALVSFWLDVPAEVAYARKPEQFTAERLAARRTLYEAEMEPVRAIRIDGTRPREEICAVIAWETWRRLS